MTTIKYPGKHDVMLGRGGESNYHSGNIAFRHMVQQYKERFRLGSRTEKNKVIDEVVTQWRDQDPIGRFVAKKKTDTGDVVWYDVGDALAKKRAAKSLAEWTPANSFQGGVAKQISPTQERRKRSRPAENTGCNELFNQEASSNKRQMIAPPAPVNSFTVMTMVASAQQLPKERLHEPLPLFSIGMDQDFLSSNIADSNQDSFSSSSSSGIIRDFLSSSIAASNQDSFSASSDAISNTAVTSLNQPCNMNININSMDVLPIDRIRFQIPTAAELAGNAFSDDSDEKSWHSNSSRGSNQGRGSCHGGLLPNKLAEMTVPFKETYSMLSLSSDSTANMAIFGGQNRLVDTTNPFKDASTIVPLACDNTVTRGIFGEKQLWMI